MLTATGAAMVTTADPDLEGSATEVAVMLTCGGEGTPAGAVYRPSCVTVPHAYVPHPAPDNVQVTPVRVVPPTKARKRCCWPSRTIACEGETDTVTSDVEPRITDALPDAVRSASDVAVTVMTFDVGAFAGALYKPPLLICPHSLPVQLMPLRLQITTLFEVPLTVAENCNCPPAGTCTVAGVTETDIDARLTLVDTAKRIANQATFQTCLILSPDLTPQLPLSRVMHRRQLPQGSYQVETTISPS